MSLVLAMSTFALAMSVSPGPVNIVTLSSGASHGVLKTLPFVSGATIGFTALLFVLGLGVAELVQGYPALMRYAGIAGAGFILYMAYKIGSARGDIALGERSRPSFLEGVLLQWLNPKAWIASISGVTAFTTKGDFSSLLLFCTLYFFICYAGIGAWAVAGRQARLLVRTERHLRLFNATMGGGLALVALYLLFE